MCTEHDREQDQEEQGEWFGRKGKQFCSDTTSCPVHNILSANDLICNPLAGSTHNQLSHRLNVNHYQSLQISPRVIRHVLSTSTSHSLHQPLRPPRLPRQHAQLRRARNMHLHPLRHHRHRARSQRTQLPRHDPPLPLLLTPV